MGRVEILTRGITKDMVGIEVGPWFSPIVPKAAGYNSLVLDVFDQDQLLARAKADGSIPSAKHALIEEVDLIGSASDIADLIDHKELSGKIDYIISSHNFEHLPNPVLFLQNCRKVLKPTGFIRMVIPDHRYCFDYFRPRSTTADFLEAFYSGRRRPSPTTLFEFGTLIAHCTRDGMFSRDWYRTTPESDIHVDKEGSYEFYKKMFTEGSDEYIDCHCSVFTQSSFELIMRELRFIDLIEFDVDAIEGSDGCEFFVTLVGGRPKPQPSTFYAQRAQLLHAIIEDGARRRRTRSPLSLIATPLKRIFGQQSPRA